MKNALSRFLIVVLAGACGTSQVLAAEIALISAVGARSKYGLALAMKSNEKLVAINGEEVGGLLLTTSLPFDQAKEIVGALFIAQYGGTQKEEFRNEFEMYRSEYKLVAEEAARPKGFRILEQSNISLNAIRAVTATSNKGSAKANSYSEVRIWLFDSESLMKVPGTLIAIKRFDRYSEWGFWHNIVPTRNLVMGVFVSEKELTFLTSVRRDIAAPIIVYRFWGDYLFENHESVMEAKNWLYCMKERAPTTVSGCSNSAPKHFSLPH